MLNKNDRITLRIVAMSGEGFGIGRYSDETVRDFVVFVASAAVGDCADVLILKVLKNYAFAKIVEIIEPSADRTESSCPVSERCGGCCYRHVDYAAELKYKTEHVRDVFKKNYPNCPSKIEDAMPSVRIDGYRNKAQFPISKDGKCGYYAINSHRVIPCERCDLTPDVFMRITKIVENYISQYSVPVYDEITQKGLLRHVCIRKAPSTGEISIVIVATSEILPHKAQFLSRLYSIDGVKSIYLNINRKNTNVIYGSKNILLWGDASITDELCGLRFEISPMSFYQVNSSTCEVLYNYVKNALDLNKNDILLDLYCGIGTIGLSCADSVGKVIGIEAVRDSVEDAVKNASLNGIENAEFFYSAASDTTEIFETVLSGCRPNVVIVDPPRKGLDAKTVEAVLSIRPEKFAYISCDPATLARDLKLFDELGGYIPSVIQPIDMFPRTKHIETVAILSRKNIVHNMKLQPEPFEMIKSGQKTIELRLFDEKRRRISAGDRVVFTNISTGETLDATVVKLHKFDSFEDLYRSLPLLQCGYTAENVESANSSDMERYYSADEQKEFGVVGIELNCSR